MTIIATDTRQFCFIACAKEVVDAGRCSCINRSTLNLSVETIPNPVKVFIPKDKISVTINEIQVTYGTKEIRTLLEELFEVNDGFMFLPKKYTYEIMPSKFHGKVAKIVEKI